MKRLFCLAVLAGIVTAGLTTTVQAGVWGLWNDPPATRPVAQPKQEDPKKEMRSASERAAETKRLALEAMRRLEQARRNAKQAEAEHRDQETAYNNKQEHERLQRKAAREAAAAQQARQDNEQLKRLMAQANPPKQKTADKAELERLRRLAAKEHEEARNSQQQAELDRLRKMAAKERAEARKMKQEAELKRLREMAVKEQEQADLERLKKMAAKERTEARKIKQEAELKRLRKIAAKEQEQADLERLKKMAAKERTEARKIKQEAELKRLREMAAEEREAAEKARRQEEMSLQSAPPAPQPAASENTTSPSTMSAQIPTPVKTAKEEYLLGPGDVLDVSVWKDESLSRTVMVAPDGVISLPLMGEIQAAGQSLKQLKSELEQRINVYVPDPVVSLDVKQTNSMQIYVIGKVNSPGRYVISSNINVLQALAMAGGLNPFADKDDIRIMRQQKGTPTHSFDFDYKKVLRGENLEQNIRLQRGDVIVVP